MVRVRSPLGLTFWCSAVASGCFSPEAKDSAGSASMSDTSGRDSDSEASVTTATDPEASATDPEASADASESSTTETDATATSTEPDAGAEDTSPGVECVEHDECPSGACRIATAECFAEENRLWVDIDAAGCEAGTGTEAAPFCQIATALGVLADRAESDPWAVFVAGSSTAYAGKIAPSDDRPLAVIGPSAGVAAVLAPEAGFAIEVGSESPETYVAHLTLRAVDEVVRGGSPCELWLSDVEIDDGEIGISTGGCTVHVLRSRITGVTYGARVAEAGALETMLTDFDNGSGGLLVQGDARLRRSLVRNHFVGGGIHIEGGHLELENSFVTYNQYENDGIANNGGTFDILYSTIVGTITCTSPGASTIRNSIVLNHMFEAGQTCTQAQVDHSVVNAGVDQGTGNVLAGPGDLAEIFVDPSPAVGNYHVIPGSIPAGVAVWPPSGPAIDAEGDARPDRAGAADYAGADVP